MSPLTLASLMMIASGSIHAVVNAIVKSGRDKMAARAVSDASSAIILLPATLLLPPPAGAWDWLALSAVARSTGTDRAGDDRAARRAGDRGSVAGIALIAAAMFALVAGRHLGRGALGWSVLTGVTIAIYTIVDAHGVRAAPTPASYIVWLFVIMGATVVAMFAGLTRGALFATMRAQWRPGAAAGALSILTYGLALAAFAMGPTAPLAALRETGMVTALIIAVVFLGEPVTVRRVAAVAGILAGAALILLD